MSIISAIRESHPLIHAITNPVTIESVANMILASGAAAICADDAHEAAEVASVVDGLLLNTGMPNNAKMDAMLRAGAEANRRGIPVVLDPAGAGVSTYRKEFLHTLMSHVQMTCIRGNLSEMAALAGVTFPSRGVEASGIDLPQSVLMELADRYHTILAVTGAVDLVVASNAVRESRTGTPLLTRITGAGCMLSGLVTAAISAQCHKMQSTDADIVFEVLNLYGRIAQETEEEIRAREISGTITFRNALIDAVSRM